jgi:NAD(P)-dependent dehydrogenase (short-subunit alcohol dehydrogenase family)
MKAALVTGALGGIGRAMCDEFTAAGYAVIATDRQPGAVPCHRFVHIELRDLCADDAARARVAATLRDALGDVPLAVIVNNAAVQILAPTSGVVIEHWRQTLDTNLVAPFMLAQALLPELVASHGSVINVASIHAVATKPGFVCYATSKAALIGLTRAMAVDLGSRVRVNALVPAAVATPMLLEGFVGAEDGLDALGGMHPIGRIANPSEVARAAVLLASDGASFVTGAALHVDGGIGARLHDPV